MDLRYLLLGDTQEQRLKALRVHLYASWDFLTYAGKFPVSPAALEGVRKYLEQLEHEDVQLAAVMAAEWKGRKKPSHWSGRGRTGAIRAINPDPKGNRTITSGSPGWRTRTWARS